MRCSTSKYTITFGMLVFAAATLLVVEANAQTTPILLHAFTGEDEVTLSTDGQTAQFVEVPFSTFVRLTNDPFVGDPEVIDTTLGTSLSFDFDFDEAPGSDDEFSAVLFAAGPNGGPFRGELVRYPLAGAGSMTINLSPYVGQMLGLEFELLDGPGGDDTTGSTGSVSNVALPEPSLGMLIANGVLGLLCLHGSRGPRKGLMRPGGAYLSDHYISAVAM